MADLKLNSSGGGSVTLTTPSTASNLTLTLPSASGTVATTTGTLTNPTINGFTGDTSVVNIGSGQIYKDTSGNLGIGTSSPTAGYRLEVSGAGIRNTATNPFFDIYASGQAADSKWWRVGGGGASFNITAINDAGSAADTPYTITRSAQIAQTHLWATAGTEKMRLDASGNLGLGVTPSAWGTLRGFQIGQAAAFAGHTSSQVAYMLGNAFYDGSNWKYVTNGYAARFDTNGNNGQCVWNIAASGSAGGTISFTQAMTLDASGNLLVGGTSVTAGTGASEKTIILEKNAASAGTWYTRTVVRNTTVDKASFLGIFDVYPGVFAHNGALNGWADLYLNYIGPSGGGNTYVNLGTGTVYTSSGRFTNTNPSDSRLKEDITPISYGLAEINKLNPVTFKFKNDAEDKKRLSWGFVAQEVQPIMPELVTTFTQHDEEYLGLETNGIYTILVKAIQELSAQNQKLEARLAQLEAK